MKKLAFVAVILLVAFALLGTMLARRTSNNAAGIVQQTIASAEEGNARTDGALQLKEWLRGRRIASYLITDKTVQFFGQSLIVRIQVRLSDGEVAVLTLKCNSYYCWGLDVPS